MTTKRQDLAKLQEAAYRQGVRAVPPAPMTVAEILQAIEESRQVVEPEHSYTGPEIAAAMGWSARRMSKEVKALIAEGKAKVVRVRRTALDGRNSSIAGYQLVR